MVEEFIRAYREEDLTSLLSLFSHDALENGEPVARYVPRYRQFFEAFRVLEYRLLDREIHASGDRVKVKGSYLVSLVPRSGGNLYWVRGTVAWTLVKDGDGRWLIDALDYTME